MGKNKNKARTHRGGARGRRSRKAETRTQTHTERSDEMGERGREEGVVEMEELIGPLERVRLKHMEVNLLTQVQKLLLALLLTWIMVIEINYDLTFLLPFPKLITSHSFLYILTTY